MGSSKQPSPPSPSESARAQLGSQMAGDIFETANKPLMGYADAYTQAMLNPYLQALQSALQARSGYQGAMAQRATQAAVDPGAFQQREMRLDAANQRLGRLYGKDPSSYTYSAPQAFATPTPGQLPDLATISAGTGAIADALRPVNTNKDLTTFSIGKPVKPNTSVPASPLYAYQGSWF